MPATAAWVSGSATIVPPSGLTPPAGGPPAGGDAAPGGGPPGGGPPGGGPPGGGPPGGGPPGGAPPAGGASGLPPAGGGGGAAPAAPAGGAGLAPALGDTLPGDGGATPSIVPFICGGGFAAGAAGGDAAGGDAAGGDAAGAAGGAPPAGGAGAPGAPPSGAAPPGRGTAGEFIMSIVPLNFGAAAPFRLNPHFEQVVAVSGFCVPQFGQNTRPPPFSLGNERPRAPPTRGRSLHALMLDSQEQQTSRERHPMGASLPR